jgi:hypothetical protein
MIKSRELVFFMALWAVSAGASSAADVAAETTTFVFDRLNGTYTDLAGEVRETTTGPILVRSNSPTNRLELIGNRIELTPLGDGVHRIDVWVQFEGEAEVEAELLMAGLSTGVVEDQVVVPNQERSVESRVNLERQDEDYLITVVETPKDFQISIQSRLASQLVSMCEGIARFAFGASCESLESSLSNPKIPMPEPGEEFVLPGGELTAEERAQLEAYLDASP